MTRPLGTLCDIQKLRRCGCRPHGHKNRGQMYSHLCTAHWSARELTDRINIFEQKTLHRSLSPFCFGLGHLVAVAFNDLGRGWGSGPSPGGWSGGSGPSRVQQKPLYPARWRVGAGFDRFMRPEPQLDSLVSLPAIAAVGARSHRSNLPPAAWPRPGPGGRLPAGRSERSGMGDRFVHPHGTLYLVMTTCGVLSLVCFYVV